MVRALWRGLSLGGRRWNEVEGELGMKARGLRWYMVSVLLAVAVPLFLATGSFAVSVPVGAESRALLLDPLLRGGVTLAFLHPQQAVLQPQQLFVLDTGGGDPYSSVGSASGMGGILVAGGQRLFLFSTRDVVSAGTMSGVQGGGPGQAGVLRLGLSAGGYLLKESTTNEHLSQSGTNYDYSFTAEDGNARSIEGLAGLGVGRGRRYLDVTWESRWETEDRATAELHWSRSDAETTIVSLEGDRRPFHLYHLRAGLPLGSVTDLVVTGQWGGRDERWKGTFRGVVFDDALFRQEALEEWRDSWNMGAAVSFPVGEIDRITGSAGWTSQKLPEYVLDPGSITQRLTSRRDGVLALSVEERVWRDITLLAGLRRTYSRTKVDNQRVDAPDSASADSRLSESLGHEFSWGGAWTRGRYHVGATVSQTLSLASPFASLDLGYRF
jgi:hypothetical protein